VSDRLLVHGLADDLVEPYWPPIVLGEVEPVLAAFGLEAVAVTWQSPRPLSSAALVATSDRSVFVKRLPDSVRTVEGLTEEHLFGAHLRGAGVPVPETLVTPRGSSAVRHGGWTYEVQERGEGNDLYRETQSWQPFFSVTHAFNAGVMLAALADAGVDFDAPARAPKPLVTSWEAIAQRDLIEGLEAFVAASPQVAQGLGDRDWRRDVARDLLPLHARFAGFADQLQPGWTHGDGHASNFLWGPGGAVSSVLDLGLCDRTTPIVDLATAIERNAVSWLNPEPEARLDLVDALLRGWSSVRPLTDVEAAALPELVPIVHVEFALSEMGYFAAVTGSPDDAEVAYGTYLLGHARWHAGAAGQALRHHLQAFGAWTSGR
jgi:Ser/Thr protein kinase RdoA (MazF antagonist)